MHKGKDVWQHIKPPVLTSALGFQVPPLRLHVPMPPLPVTSSALRSTSIPPMGQPCSPPNFRRGAYSRVYTGGRRSTGTYCAPRQPPSTAWHISPPALTSAAAQSPPELAPCQKVRLAPHLSLRQERLRGGTTLLRGLRAERTKGAGATRPSRTAPSRCACACLCARTLRVPSGVTPASPLRGACLLFAIEGRESAVVVEDDRARTGREGGVKISAQGPVLRDRRHTKK
ncbi:hypothetical protein C8Q77DRAFT_210170 [Trametes polyzona]|nr:hypothetical protein C8Q77DRAFT_210170 [Trametes polyzona]